MLLVTSTAAAKTNHLAHPADFCEVTSFLTSAGISSAPSVGTLHVAGWTWSWPHPRRARSSVPEILQPVTRVESPLADDAGRCRRGDSALRAEQGREAACPRTRH